MIAEVQTNRELLPCENHVSIYPNSASLLSRSPFLLRHERVEHWERIASRGRPAFSSHLVSSLKGELASPAVYFTFLFCKQGVAGSNPATSTTSL